MTSLSIPKNETLSSASRFAFRRVLYASAQVLTFVVAFSCGCGGKPRAVEPVSMKQHEAPTHIASEFVDADSDDTRPATREETDAESLVVLHPQESCPSALGGVVVTPDRLEIDQPVYFQTGETILLKKSLPLLTEVAEVLRLCPKITIEVQCHTDSRGSSAWNYWLSHDRARAVVRYLVELGVSADRLTFQGFGEVCPIYVESEDPLATARRSRRVELVRTDRGAPRSCPPPESPPSMPAEYEKQRK